MVRKKGGTVRLPRRQSSISSIRSFRRLVALKGGGE